MFKQEINFFILAFTSLFTMVNPFGVMPMFINYANDLSSKDTRIMARKAVFTAFVVMMVFALSGHFIFKFFDISIDALKVVGGVLFFIMGYDMLQAKPPRTKVDEESEEDFNHEVAITPLGVPLICGPGTITIVILMNQQAVDIEFKAILYTAMAVVSFLTYIFLIGSKLFLKVVGPYGNKVMFRIMGLILMVIAVEYFFAGLKPLLKS